MPETRAAYEAALSERFVASLPKPVKPAWTTLPGLALPLIGREAAWKQLEDLYGRLRAGGLIIISGEPGIGKSRLLQEFATGRERMVLRQQQRRHPGFALPAPGPGFAPGPPQPRFVAGNQADLAGRSDGSPARIKGLLPRSARSPKGRAGSSPGQAV